MADDGQSNGKPEATSGSGPTGRNDAMDFIDTLKCENVRLRELLLRPSDEAERFRKENARLRAKVRSLEAERSNDNDAAAGPLRKENERLRAKIRSLEAEPASDETGRLRQEVARLRAKIRSFVEAEIKGKPVEAGPKDKPEQDVPGRPQTDNSPDVSARVIAASTADVMASAVPLSIPPGYVNRNEIFPNKKYPLIPFINGYCDIDKLAWQIVNYKQNQSDDPTTSKYLTLATSSGQRHHYVRVSVATTDNSFEKSAHWIRKGIEISASKDGDTKATARRVDKFILRKYQDAVNQAMDECGYEQINYNPGGNESNDPYGAILKTEVPPPDYINYDGSSTSEKANIQWNLMYAEVLKWKEEHGTPNVPQRTKKGERKNGLENFVTRMRTNKDKLGETRVRLVRKICFRSCAMCA